MLNSKLSLNSKPREKPSDTEEIKIYIDYIGEDGYVYKYSPSLKKYIKSSICLIGPRGNSGPKGEDGKVDYKRLKDEINLDDYATIEYVDEEIAALINGAPETLDTLKEIADYIESRGKEFFDLVERINTLEECCDEVQSIIENIQSDITNLQNNKADKTELNKYVLKSGDTMTGTLNFDINPAISIKNILAVALSDDKMSFGNVNNLTQICSNDHINIKTDSNNWTVWDSGNFDPKVLERNITNNETAISTLNQTFEEYKQIISNNLADLEERKLDKSEAGELNVIETIKVNGESLNVENKSVNITVPTKVSDLINDSVYNNVTYDELIELKENNNLYPGQKYRITDYVTTTMQDDTDSAEIPFDIIVTAISNKDLSKNAFAIQNTNNEYFNNSDLTAWKLIYTTDNIYWSKLHGTYLEATQFNFWFKSVDVITINDVEYTLWYNEKFVPNNVNMTKGYIVTQVDGTEYYLINLNDNTISESLGTVGNKKYISEDGKGTILWLKDEFNNEAPYDFKNIKFKRWKISSDSYITSGVPYYIISNLYSCPVKTKPSDEQDFIWVYTFSSLYNGNEDLSLSGRCHNNHIIENDNHILSNNVIFGVNNTVEYNSIGNSIQNSDNNIIQGNYNVFGTGCNNNVVKGNNNYISSYCINNILDCGTSYNRISIQNSTLEQDCQYNDISSGEHIKLECGCSYITLPPSNYIIVESGNKYIEVLGNGIIRNIKIAQGVNNTTTLKTIVHQTSNDEYQTIYKSANSQIITI